MEIFFTFGQISVQIMMSKLVMMMVCVCLRVPSHVQHFVTPWAAAYQAPLSMGFARVLEWVAIAFSNDTIF